MWLLSSFGPSSLHFGLLTCPMMWLCAPPVVARSPSCRGLTRSNMWLHDVDLGLGRMFLLSRTRVCVFTYTPCDRVTYTLRQSHVHLFPFSRTRVCSHPLPRSLLRTPHVVASRTPCPLAHVLASPLYSLSVRLLPVACCLLPVACCLL